MPVSVGSRLAHYHVTGWLGAGGMGEVFRARDSKLDREVAIKVLAASLAPDLESLRRFEREARVLASLNHPNIAQIYGIEEADGHLALVLELVDGPSLDALIAPDGSRSGGLPPGSVVGIGRQIASALEAAHQKGIIHRDLKPANVKVTPGGTVKVLDFGIAKAVAPGDPQQATSATTRATPATEGAVMGTVPYMSPEQALGRAVDARADVWAFGCVLFELLAGRHPFEGNTSWETVAAIIEREPAWDALSPGTPAALVALLRRCLEKDPARRLPSMAEARAALDGITSGTHTAAPPPRRAARRVRISRLAVMAGIAAGAVAMAVALMSTGDSPPPLTFSNSRQVTTAIGVEDYPTLSPDGRTVAYESNQSGNWDVWVTQVGGGAAVNRTDDYAGHDRYPSWSPDGSQIAFWSERDGGGYFLMPAVGGAATPVAATVDAGAARHGPAAWSPDGEQLALVSYVPDGDGLRPELEIVDIRTRASRRQPMPGTEESRLDLCWSPDGRLLAYVDAAQQPAETTSIRVLRLSDGASFDLTDGSANARSPRWSPDGRDLYFVWNTSGAADLWRRAIGPDGAPEGPARQVTTGVEVLHAGFSSSGDKLVFAKGRWVANVWRVPLDLGRPATWADATQITFEQAFIEFIDLSPDGRTLAFSSDRAGNQDLWTFVIESGALTRVTSDDAPEWAPRWSPDGRSLAFYASRTGDREIYVMPIERGEVRRLTSSPGMDATPDWSPDGRWLAFRSERLGSSDIWVVSADGREQRVIAPHPEPEYAPTWSPDGKWIAFGSHRDGGRARLWRVPFPDGTPEPLTEGASYGLRWSRHDGRIYYKGSDEGARDVWSIAPGETAPRRVTNLSGRRGALGAQPPVAGARFLYFTWREDPADIWVIDVLRE